jgi:hypothetical protein
MDRIVDFGDYPEIRTDGIADVQFIGNDVHFLQFRWKRIDSIWRPVIVVNLIRPVARIAAHHAWSVSAGDLAAVPGDRPAMAFN